MSTKPELKNFDDMRFGDVIARAKEYVEDVWELGYDGIDDDFANYMLEEVIKACFGKDVFDKLNANYRKGRCD